MLAAMLRALTCRCRFCHVFFHTRHAGAMTWRHRIAIDAAAVVYAAAADTMLLLFAADVADADRCLMLMRRRHATPPLSAKSVYAALFRCRCHCH